jgi:cholesterol transport system auxiliary component
MNRRSLLTLGSALLAGCSVLPARENQQRRDWPLVPRRSSVVPPPKNGRILLIRTMTAAPGLEARGVQWLLKDGSLNSDYYEQWAAPPYQAMEEGLRRWLSDAGLFSAVVAPGSRVTAEFALESELTSLVADPRAGTARASLSLVLLEPKGDQTRVRLQRTETAEVKLNGTGVEAIVAGLREAAAAVLGQAEESVAGAIR